jgi:hypothetical protein
MNGKPFVSIALAVVCGYAWADGAYTDPDSLGALRELHRQQGLTETAPVEPLHAGASEEVRTTVYPLVKVRKNDGHEHVKVLPVIVGEAYSFERHGDRTETELLDVPFASLMKREENGPDHKEVRIVNLPFTTMIEAEEHDDSRSLKLVDIPFFTLLDNKDHGDGNFDNKFIKLPIIGSLFRHKRTDDEEKVKFLIFSHTRRIHDDDRRVHRETREERYRKMREARY